MIVFEILIVIALLSVFIISGLIVLWLPWQLLLMSGIAGMILGLLVGVPAGFYYHIRLRQILLQKPPLPERWWIRPTMFHDRLEGEEKKGIMVWFYLGAVGFLLSIVGSFITMLGVVTFW